MKPPRGGQAAAIVGLMALIGAAPAWAQGCRGPDGAWSLGKLSLLQSDQELAAVLAGHPECRVSSHGAVVADGVTSDIARNAATYPPSPRIVRRSRPVVAG